MAQPMTLFNDFKEQIGLMCHNLNIDTHRVALCKTDVPVVTNTILANITQTSNGNGYTTLGEDAQNSWAENPAGTGTLTAAKITWTAGPAAMDTVRWMVYYANQATTLTNPLIGWWEYAGGALVLQVGETLTWKPNSGDTGTVFTITG